MALKAPPFVSRFADGTTEDRNAYFARIHAERDASNADREVQRQAAIAKQWAAHANRLSALAPVTATAPVATPFSEAAIKAKVDAGTLNMTDALAARKAGNNPLADAITRRLAGMPWTYAWATPTTPVPAPKPGPQVIVYPEDVWENNPTNDWFNGKDNPYLMDQLANNAWKDPATGAYLQAERNINAKTFMDLDDDPIRQGFIRSQYERGNRDYETERSRVMRSAPIGVANQYTRTG